MEGTGVVEGEELVVTAVVSEGEEMGVVEGVWFVRGVVVLGVMIRRRPVMKWMTFPPTVLTSRASDVGNTCLQIIWVEREMGRGGEIGRVEEVGRVGKVGREGRERKEREEGGKGGGRKGRKKGRERDRERERGRERECGGREGEREKGRWNESTYSANKTAI